MRLAAAGILAACLITAAPGIKAFAEPAGAPVLNIAPKLLERSLFSKPYQTLVISGTCPAKTEVVIKVVSPARSFRLNRAGKGLGFVWLPSGHAEVAQVPVMYAILSSAKISGAISPAEQERAGVCPDFRHIFQQASVRFQKEMPGDESAKLRREYVSGLVSILRKDGMYKYEEGAVKIDAGSFRAQLAYPASAPLGEYRVFLYLVNNGALHLVCEDKLRVKSGRIIEWLSYHAQASPAMYGTFSALVAVLVGLFVGVVLGRGAGH